MSGAIVLFFEVGDVWAMSGRCLVDEWCKNLTRNFVISIALNKINKSASS
jgi:hypothetical protein